MESNTLAIYEGLVSVSSFNSSLTIQTKVIADNSHKFSQTSRSLLHLDLAACLFLSDPPPRPRKWVEHRFLEHLVGLGGFIGSGAYH
eukprot:4586153-Amphidinium_carterae.1